MMGSSIPAYKLWKDDAAGLTTGEVNLEDSPEHNEEELYSSTIIDARDM